MTCQNCGHELAPTLKFCPKCGTPASAPSYAPPAAQIQSSWSHDPQYAPQPQGKSRVGKILLIIGVLLLLIVVGAGFAVYYGYKYLERTVKSSEAYVLAETTLKESPAVREKLGEIKKTGFPIGDFSESADGTGRANFTVPVLGEKASGQYVVAMSRASSVWRVTRAFVKLDNDEFITVVGPAGERGSESAHDDDMNANHHPPPEPVNTNNTNRSAPPKTISGGVLNGKATSKPEPPYPPAARAARAEGTVTVQVTVDEEGKVVSASAISGHPLLQAAAVSAARQARFSPTLLSGKPVRVTGQLTYNFVLKE